MIRHSFVLLERIQQRKERALWQQGITTWDEFWKASSIKGIAPEKKYYYDRRLREAQQALQQGDSSYFPGKLPQKEMWRLYDSFRDECCFLDIETDVWGKITVVGVSNYYQTWTFVQSANLDRGGIEQLLSRFKILITFNGSSFDVPKLKKQLRVEVRMPHIDLKPLCVNLGLKGGLKEVERILNLKRPAHLLLDPIACWENFLVTGDREQLDLLIGYNTEDIENLKGVMEYVYKKMCQRITSSTHF